MKNSSCKGIKKVGKVYIFFPVFNPLTFIRFPKLLGSFSLLLCTRNYAALLAAVYGPEANLISIIKRNEQFPVQSL